MKFKYIFPAVVALAGMLLSAGEVAAQFSMNAIGRNADLSAPMPLRHPPVKVDIVNAAKARMMRKELWRQRNAVDFRISATGTVTHFNKSWTTNNQNAISAEISSYYYHTYNRGRHIGTFKFDGLYGMNFIDDTWFKNQDLLKLYYLASWKLKEKGFLRNWAYSFSTAFASQFSRGFKGRSEGDRDVPWSNFMAPGTLNTGVGLTYTSPDKKFPLVVTVNPVSGNALFVLDDRIDDERRKKLGIPVPRDMSGRLIRHKIEGGSNLNIAFNRTFSFGKTGMTLQYNTTMSSFYGWMTQLARHKTDVDDGVKQAIKPVANWTNSFIFNPLKFLSLEFRTTTLYDRSQIDRVQMQYYLRVGLTYRYKNK